MTTVTSNLIQSKAYFDLGIGEGLDLPCYIYLKNKEKIVLRLVENQPEKDNFFVKNKENIPNALIVKGNYQYEFFIENEDDSKRHSEIKNFLNFALIIVIGWQMHAVLGMPGAASFISRRFYSTKKISKISPEHIARISNLIKLYDDSKNGSRDKLELFRSIYAYITSNQASIPRYECTLYCSILEAIYIPGDNSELNYKLALRLASFFDFDRNIFENMKKIYSHRSKLLHGTKHVRDGFRVEDQIFLEKYTGLSVEKFMKCPNAYLGNSIDDNFFKS